MLEKQLAIVKPGTPDHRNTEDQNTGTVKFRNTKAPEQQKFLIWYKFWLYRYVTRTNVSFFDPSPNDQRTENSCA